MENRRPDPDELLRQVQEAESRAGRARLKVFLGAAPGVGKTYAMLQEARSRWQGGLDVVAGVVETHGRAETQALLEGLPVLPRIPVAYRGVELQEFDLDGVLARRPRLVLVDELAHTNAPGCRHGKRWQDVLELLDAGIDVYTTVNVQHFETNRDAVAKVTGVLVRETVPDTVLERADEVELVDIPVEELQARLQEGKVYVPEQARSAISSFFRKGNLLALREMALRKTADRVDADMRRYMREAGIQQTWPATDRILAVVESDPEGSQVVRAAARLASALGASWVAVHVERPTGLLYQAREEEQAQEHLRLAERLGGEALALQPTGLKVSQDLLGLARSRNATRIVVGRRRGLRWASRLLGSLAEELVRDAGDLHVHVVSLDPKEQPKPALVQGARSAPTRPFGYAAAAVAATSAVGSLLRGHLDLADLAMLYLLCIAVIAARWGRAASVAASLLSVAALNFLFVPPIYTFVVADLKHVGTFVIMLGVGFAVGDMAERIRSQARTAQARERHTSTLFRLSAELAREGDPQRIQAAILSSVKDRFRAEAILLLQHGEDELAEGHGSPPASEEERAVALWALRHRKPAGRGTDTLPGAAGFWLPLMGAAAPVGVLGVVPARERPVFDAAERDLLDALAAQAALALERARLQAERESALRRADREQLRNALLSSVSHDLRTPLGAITGAASSLLDPGSGLREEDRRELLLTIFEEAERLHRLVTNLLDITRLESGTLQVRKEWVPLEEIVGSALARMENPLRGREVRLDLPEALVPVDPVLLEQVLVNLLDNAAKYSPEGQPLEVEARQEQGRLTLTVSDHGPGIAAGEEERIFDKLARGSTPSNRPGAGLGLAICRGIVHAHGGHIRAANRPQGGARFSLTLPTEGVPGAIPLEETSRG